MDAVVFDFDGVIVKSIEQHAEAYRRVLEPMGIPVPQRAVLLSEGARSETIILELARDAGRTLGDLEVTRLANEKQQVFRDMGTPGLYPCVEMVLRQIWEQDIPTAIVTGTRRDNLEAMIPNLVNKFTTLQTQESYNHDKPHPEPYLNAATALGIDPANCICVENAIRGIQSAKAAGYGHVVGITTTLDAATLQTAHPDIIVPDHVALMSELLQAIA
jgi:beta-phosphoglucomutase